MKIIKNILFTLMFMLLASSVCAVASFTVSELDFGSDSQLRGQDTTALLHITNDGTDSVSLSLSSTLAPTYNIRFSQASLTLASNTSIDVTVTMLVPMTQTSSKTLLNGNIIVTSTNVAGLSKTASVYVITRNMLDISKVTIDIDGSEHTLREGDTYTDSNILKAGTPITIRVYAKNMFTSSEDVTIENVGVDLRSSGNLDIDDSQDIGDLNYGDKESVSFSADIPSDAEDGDRYNLDITATGRDTNGVLYEHKYSTTIEIKKEAHEILINNPTFSPKTITTCSNNRVTLNADLKNTGRYNENNVALEIINNELDISQRFNQINLNTDDTIRKTYSFIVPNNTLPGQYDFMLNSYYSSSQSSSTSVVSLIVEPCVVQQPPVVNNQTNSNSNTNVITPQIPPVINTNGATPVYGTASFADSTLYITLLIIAVIVMVIILIILLVKFVF